MPPVSDTPIAVVTGAARGIGQASAMALARRGFALALADRLTEKLASTQAELRALDGDALVLPGSVADFQGVLANGRAVLEHFGRIDVLVNNAGISQPKTLVEISEEVVAFLATVSPNFITGEVNDVDGGQYVN